MSNSNLGCFI